MGIAMLTASVIRKIPKMKPISRIAAKDMKKACDEVALYNWTSRMFSRVYEKIHNFTG